MDEKIIITEDTEQKRLDILLFEHNSNYTRSHYKNMIEEGNVLVNGKIVKAGYNTKKNDEVLIKNIEPKKMNLDAENIPLEIVYEDEDLAVINKPQGMVVHPAVGNYSGTLVNALLYNIKNLSGINGVVRPGIVHRLDKDTSGLIIVAKNDFAHVNLSRQIQNKTCKRYYMALMEGRVEDGVVINYLTRDTKNRLKYMVSENNIGKLSESHYKCIEQLNGYSLVEWELKTGRTHQIRIHSAYIHHPIVGDKLYNSHVCKFNINGQLLHSYKIQFTQPRTNELLKFEVDLPDYFKKVLQHLKK